MIYEHTSVDELPLEASLAARLRAAGVATLGQLARARLALPELTPAERSAVRRLLGRPDVIAATRTLVVKP